MANQKTERTRKKKTRHPPGRTNPDAAGIDLGAIVHYVAVPADRDEKPVRHFGTLTEDLTGLADWLKQCGITTVAMEATGVYRIPLFQILEDRGFEVCLVNARHVKNVPGRKSDVQDCQWLQYLHSVGLLNASFRPPADICAVRSLLRHRESMMRTACQHLLRIQKSLDQMNVQLHHAATDITGYTKKDGSALQYKDQDVAFQGKSKAGAGIDGIYILAGSYLTSFLQDLKIESK